MEELVRDIIGPDSNAITWWQMSIRGVIGFLFTLALIRAGDKRIFGKSTALDIVMGIILGSIISRAITGNSPFFPALITSAVLVFLHWALSKLSIYTKIGNIVKGHHQQLVKDGQMLRHTMEKHQITEEDLMEALRTNGSTQEIAKVEAAYLERSGSISVITKS